MTRSVNAKNGDTEFSNIFSHSSQGAKFTKKCCMSIANVTSPYFSVGYINVDFHK